MKISDGDESLAAVAGAEHKIRHLAGAYRAADHHTVKTNLVGGLLTI